jgi:viroplasmin and RNaseH domain-containing protein
VGNTIILKYLVLLLDSKKYIAPWPRLFSTERTHSRQMKNQGKRSLDLSVWENRYKISKKNQTANAKPFIHSDRGEKPRSNNCDIIAYLCNEKQGQSDFHSKKNK